MCVKLRFLFNALLQYFPFPEKLTQRVLQKNGKDGKIRKTNRRICGCSSNNGVCCYSECLAAALVKTWAWSLFQSSSGKYYESTSLKPRVTERRRATHVSPELQQDLSCSDDFWVSVTVTLQDERIRLISETDHQTADGLQHAVTNKSQRVWWGMRSETQFLPWNQYDLFIYIYVSHGHTTLFKLRKPGWEKQLKQTSVISWGSQRETKTHTHTVIFSTSKWIFYWCHKGHMSREKY